MIENLDMQSPNWTNLNAQFIAERFPNCVTETSEGIKIDFDLLKQELSNDVVEGTKERYRLEWPGKKEAIVTTNIPTTKTLRPIREDSVDFDNTENIYIEGDNLEVLKLLQESYLGKIKMIYIDPPYNTGHDFVYKDNFAKETQDELLESGQKDEYNQRLITNPESSGRYHSDWLSMMYPRLKLARNLLTKDGVIFISIGQNELSNLIQLSDEIYGETNRISVVGRLAKSGGNKGKFFSPNIEYLVVLSKNIDSSIGFRDEMDEDLIKKVYTKIEVSGIRKGEKYRAMGLFQSSLDPMRGCVNQRYFIKAPDGTLIIPPGDNFPDDKFEGSKTVPQSKKDGVWRWTYPKYVEEYQKGNVEFNETNNKVLVDSEGNFSKWNVNTKIWLKDREEEGQQPNDFISKYENRHSSKELQELNIAFDFAKPVGLIKYLTKISQTKKDDIILDFFSGSATTAHAVMELNAEDNQKRKYILVQIPENSDEKSEAYRTGFRNICEIGKERIRRAATKIKEDKLQKEKNEGMFADSNDTLDYGFRVYRLDETNMQEVYYKPKEYNQSELDLFSDNIKPGRNADDLLVQVMLDWGLPLSLKIIQEIIVGKQVYKVANNSLYACFDNDIDEQFAKELAKDKPLRVVFKDSGFKDDTAKTNVKQLLKQLSPDTEMKVL
jgi:adenine-specific DNA-methyltransferase